MTIPIAYWAPSQATIAQVETYTFTAPNAPGNTYTATENGKSVTYTSIAGDTAASVATALFQLLNQTSNIPAEMQEIQFANPSAGVMTATAREAGTPFANVLGTTKGLVMSTGGGLTNGIATVHTQPNQSPSDVSDPLNWLRVMPPGTPVNSLPQGDDLMVVANSSVPMRWNLDQLAGVQVSGYQRQQSMTGDIGLPVINPNGYYEWRAPYLVLSGPAGGALQMILGEGAGTGKTNESYNVGNQLTELTVLGGGTVNFISEVTTSGSSFSSSSGSSFNTINLLGGVTLNAAMNIGEVANLGNCLVGGSATLNVGAGVEWVPGATLTVNGASASLGSAPTTIVSAGGSITVVTDGLTWTSITAQLGSTLTWLSGGTIDNIVLTTNSILDKSGDARPLTIIDSTVDGNTCSINDPLNVITYTNPTTVTLQTTAGPFKFTGPRTVKVV